MSSTSIFISVTDDFSVHVITNKTSISIRSQAFYHRADQVVVSLKNDTFIFEQKNGIIPAAFISTLFGILLLIIGFLIVNKIYEFIKK